MSNFLSELRTYFATQWPLAQVYINSSPAPQNTATFYILLKAASFTQNERARGQTVRIVDIYVSGTSDTALARSKVIWDYFFRNGVMGDSSFALSNYLVNTVFGVFPPVLDQNYSNIFWAVTKLKMLVAGD